MHHFFVDATRVRGGRVELDRGDTHHATRVLRVRAGERISIADGAGRLLEAVVTDVGDAVAADVASERVVCRTRPEIVLVQAIAKGDRMDDAVTRSVEVGAARIVPFVSARTIVRWDEKKREQARERWEAVAIAAAKQCRSPWKTTIDPIRDDVAGVGQEFGLAVVLDGGAAQRLRDVLPAEAPDSVALVIGPEGGLDDDELSSLRSSGGVVASLGERILRTETAGPVAAALVSHVYGNLG